MVSNGDNHRKIVQLFLDFLQHIFMVIGLVALVYYDWFPFFVGAIGASLVV